MNKTFLKIAFAAALTLGSASAYAATTSNLLYVAANGGRVAGAQGATIIANNNWTLQAAPDLPSAITVMDKMHPAKSFGIADTVFPGLVMPPVFAPLLIAQRIALPSLKVVDGVEYATDNHVIGTDDLHDLQDQITAQNKKLEARIAALEVKTANFVTK